MESLLNKATEAFRQYDACDECGKRTDGLMICTLPDGDRTKLCPDCMDGNSFCFRCGKYREKEFPEDWYCGPCLDEIEDIEDIEDDLEDPFREGSKDY